MEKYTIVKSISKALYGDIVLSECNGEEFAMKRMVREYVIRKKTLSGGLNVPEDGMVEMEINTKIMNAKSKFGKQYVLVMKDIVHTKDMIHLVMPYCKHGDLFKKVMEQPCTLEMARIYMQQIIAGVYFLHTEIGVAHRDLSLENILINDDNDIQLCDFGLAMDSTALTNTLAGKSFYMAPEVHANQLYVPAKADSWSLGIILFIMITGFPLVEEAHHTDVRFAYLEKHGFRKLLASFKLQHLPEPLVHLLEGLLYICPTKRINVKDALQHPWLNPQNKLSKFRKTMARFF